MVSLSRSNMCRTENTYKTDRKTGRENPEHWNNEGKKQE